MPFSFHEFPTLRASASAHSFSTLSQSAGGTQNEQTVTFRVVYRTDVDATCRLVWEGRNHDVIAADPVKRDGWLYITCLQGVKDGR